MSPSLPSEKMTTLKFHLHSLSFTPYKENADLTNKTIIKSIFGYLNTELLAGRGHMIDRNKGRTNEDSRPIFMSVAKTDLKKSRISGTIALLRTGRIPALKPKGTFDLVEIDNKKMEIAERTHFFIDYSKSNCIVCIEFNNNGPRFPDLIFYLRHIAQNESWAKSLNAITFMDKSLDQAVAELSNVLNLSVKAQPKKLSNLDTVSQNYFSAIQKFGTLVKPQFVKLEASFQKQGKKVGKRESNEDANKMVKYLLKCFQGNPELIENFDNFVVDYEDKEGHDQVLNLLKGKREISIDVNMSTLNKPGDWYNLIESDFDQFVSTI